MMPNLFALSDGTFVQVSQTRQWTVNGILVAEQSAIAPATLVMQDMGSLAQESPVALTLKYTLSPAANTSLSVLTAPVLTPQLQVSAASSAMQTDGVVITPHWSITLAAALSVGATSNVVLLPKTALLLQQALSLSNAVEIVLGTAYSLVTDPAVSFSFSTEPLLQLQYMVAPDTLSSETQVSSVVVSEFVEPVWLRGADSRFLATQRPHTQFVRDEAESLLMPKQRVLQAPERRAL